MKLRNLVVLSGFRVAAFASMLSLVPIFFTAIPSLANSPCNQTECSGQYHETDFWVTVASDNGIDGRLTTEVEHGTRSGDIFPKGMKIHCIGWTYGEKVKALGLGTEDARWYLVEVPGLKSIGYAGNTRYVPAAWVFGDAPGSTPLP